MLKKILLILSIFIGLSAYASDNYLNSVIIDNNDNVTSIILRSDEVTTIKRDIESPDKMVITLKGITQSPDISTLYKNTSKVKGLAIQSDKNNELKLFIEAPQIAKANIIFDTPNSSPITVRSQLADGKVAWSIISVILLLFVMRSTRNSKVKEKPDVNELIKEREMAMYREFQKSVSSMPSMNYKLKSYKKHVLKGETIRNYDKYLTRI